MAVVLQMQRAAVGDVGQTKAQEWTQRVVNVQVHA